MVKLQVGSVRVEVDTAQLKAWGEKAVTKQVPFATAAALSRIAVVARDEVRDDLPEHFKIRSGWVARGIRAVVAKKSDWPKPTSTVGVEDEFMLLQETGGVKMAKLSHHVGALARVAVPTRAVPRGANGAVRTSWRPKNLLASRQGPAKPGRRGFKGPRAFKSDRYGGSIILAQPRAGGLSKHLTVLYFLRAQTRLKPRFEFRKTVEGVYRSVWAEYFTAALEQALRTPKRAKT